MQNTGIPHILLPFPCKQQLQNHVIGQQDIGGIVFNLLPFLLALLASITLIGNREILPIIFCKLVDLFHLGIDQGIHWVHQHSLYPWCVVSTQDMVKYGPQKCQ